LLNPPYLSRSKGGREGDVLRLLHNGQQGACL
jgi:hypothetical protein